VTPGHNGNPAWHPNGQYIIFQVQDTTLQILPSSWQSIAYRVTNPGYGTNNNLWLMTADGSQMWQLTQVTAGQGVLHPHFNPTGNKVVWAFKYDYNGPDQQWQINLADLVFSNGVPSLQNIRGLKPVAGVAFYETMGFSPDGTTILFAAGSPSQQTLNVYSYNLATKVLTNLTNTGAGVWNEHSHYARDNSRIIFDSSMNITMTRSYYVPFMDYWTMNTDGTNKVRLTYFNDPSAPEYYPYGLVAADFDFSGAASVTFGSLEQVQANGSMFYALSALKFQY
jgi:Tol biopolymer transport system component